MKALSLHQPYASLIAQGAKRIETRGKGTTYRGPLLIHAAKAWGAEQRASLERIRDMQPRIFELFDPRDMPFGAVVAVAQLVHVRRMDEAWIKQQTELELDVGAYEVGRYGWVLKDVCRLMPPIPLRGMQAAPFTVNGATDVSIADLRRLQAAGAA